MSVVTAPVAVAVLAVIAIAVSSAMMRRLRAAKAALHACEAKHRESVERERRMESTNQMAGDVAHDLNDLLTAIAGHTELLMAGMAPSASGLQEAREIRDAALRAARLTRPLRGLNATTVVDVNAVTAHAMKSVEQMLGPNIHVVLALGGDVKRIRIGATHLEERLLNLAIRARDAMPNGGRLTVTTTMHSHDRHHPEGVGPSQQVRLVVADTGDAISAEKRAQLFEPFFAGEDDSTSAMALAKVNAIVRQARGRIQVEPAPGGGTAFTIDLPATSEAAAGAMVAATAARVTPPVLVVEDEPGLRELIKVVLARAGHEVVAVAGPHAALAALNRQPAIKLALMDVVMPEMDGYDLATEARKISPGIHVVFMSAFAHDSARHPGGDAFLAKPFTVESLTGTVREALDRCV
jgi:signal transduction histidine kinase/CheY-like chemotaxis protein